VSLADYIYSQFHPDLPWDDVSWLRTIWDGPIVLKGIQSVVGDRHEIICDGGVRRGSDIVKALDLLHSDVCRTMAVVDARSMLEVDRELLELPHTPERTAGTPHGDLNV
jgi:hypothetical protein